MRGTLASLTLAITLSAPAFAASTVCAPADPTPQSILATTTAAAGALEVLAGIPEPVALIARVGQDLTSYGVNFSHMAFAVRRQDGWYVVHKLNECNTSKAGIYEQTLFEFFEDSDVTKPGAIWRLDAKVAKALEAALAGEHLLDYHEPSYSMVQYPFSTKHQNSNGWVLEMLASVLGASGAEPKRATAQAWLQAAGYLPQTVEVGFFKRLGARMTQESIFFDDHPGERRWAGQIDTITVDSVMQFLRAQPLGCHYRECAATLNK
ncbi:DUF2145 domain-containing protein [Achromobacter xylosoxidans]|uniref:DUF2145 domain-containing protein n=1 Tax=Achromobacter anxifer TaxID=1287737 RepID=UPI00155CBCA7|nr:DUF2145 domain-containing protein [Achromobacter anxifer]CAB5514637.1 hypothetical protein LMG26857_03696 [Achromobacter anxifer]